MSKCYGDASTGKCEYPEFQHEQQELTKTAGKEKEKKNEEAEYK